MLVLSWTVVIVLSVFKTRLLGSCTHFRHRLMLGRENSTQSLLLERALSIAAYSNIKQTTNNKDNYNLFFWLSMSFIICFFFNL